MSSFWSQLSTEQLRFIIQCDDINKVYDYLEQGEGYEYLVENEIPYDKTTIVKKIRRKYKKQLSNAKISYPLFGLINDSPSAFPMMLSALLDGTALAFMSVSVLSCVMAGALILAGIAYTVLTYLEVRNAKRKDKAFFDLMHTQLACTKALLQKQNKPVTGIAEFEFVNDSKPTMLKSSLNVWLFSAAVLFGTYYLTAAAIMAAVGLTAVYAAMTSGIGLGVALVVALGIGLALGIKQYHVSRNAKRRTDYKTHLHNQVTRKIIECNKRPSLQRRLRDEKLIQAPVHSSGLQQAIYETIVPETFGDDVQPNQIRFAGKHAAGMAGGGAATMFRNSDNNIREMPATNPAETEASMASMLSMASINNNSNN